MADLDSWLSALHDSHDRLVSVAGGLSADDVQGRSYASDWSIAQVLSHLGSGAEIFSLFLAAGADQQPAPGMEKLQPIWERWNAKTPTAQAADALQADARFFADLEALSDQRRQDLHLSLFGQEQDLGDLLRLRLGEHAIHVWDIAVARDSTATIA